MAKRRRKWSQSIYAKYISEGRGQGQGKNYIPWIRVQDFASHGIVSRIYSAKTGRMHHLLSNNEKYYFYLLEWSESVIDIREQFPLADVQAAMEIAAKAHIRYPIDYSSGFPYVMTCDFMVTTQNGLKARTIKQTEELKNPRVIEKLEIERRYWNRLEVDWKIITQKDILISKAKIIEWVRLADVSAGEWDIGLLNEARNRFVQSTSAIVTVANGIDDEFSLPIGTGMSLFRHLILTREIPLNNINIPCCDDSRTLIDVQEMRMS